MREKKRGVGGGRVDEGWRERVGADSHLENQGGSPKMLCFQSLPPRFV